MKPSTRRGATFGALALVLVILAASACHSGAGGLGRAPVAMASSPREAPTAAADALAELSGGNSAFAFDLFRAIRGEEGNLFFSPYSMSVALAMAYAGAQNETERQMAATLHYTLPQGALHPAFNALDLSLTAQRGKEAGSFQLSIANAPWGQSGFPWRAEFLETLARHYGAGVRLVDYTTPDNREKARQTINAWVKEETRGKIEELLSRGILNERTRFVLANAVYFKGEWVTPFQPRLEDGPFHLLDGSTVTVPMMSRRAQTRYAEGEGYQAVALPYKGGRMEMIVLLPAPGQFAALERSLDAGRFRSILLSLERKDIKLYMPKFAFAADLKLEETLAEMGMPDAFDPDKADFLGMYDWDKVRANLFLAHVVHKAFVAVDQKGTEAAAATGVVGEIVSQPLEVRVDRPFIFAIYDGETETVLFLGRFAGPS